MTPVRLLRLGLNIGVVTGTGVFLASNGPALVDAAVRARHVTAIPAIAGLVLSALAILNRAGGARASHRSVGLTVPKWSMLRPTMTAFAADKVIRVGGLSGLAVMARHGDQSGYEKGTVIASTLVGKVTSFASLGLCLIASIATLGYAGKLTGWWLAASLGFAIYTIGAVIIGAALARYRSFAERWWRRVEMRAPRACRSVAGSDPIETIAHGVAASRRHPALVAQVLLHAVLGKALGAGMLFAAAAAVGAPLTRSSVLIIYSTVLLSSIASVTPGGLGAVEASATAVLLGAGSDVGDALLTIALFRVFDLWLPLVTGAVASRRRRGQMPLTSSDRTALSNRPSAVSGLDHCRSRRRAPVQRREIRAAELERPDFADRSGSVASGGRSGKRPHSAAGVDGDRVASR